MICDASPCKAAALLADVDVAYLRRCLEEWRYAGRQGESGRDSAAGYADDLVVELDHSGLLDIIERIQAGYSE